MPIDHNPQQAYVNHEMGTVDYGSMSAIFLSWFLAANITATVGFAVILGLLKDLGILWHCDLCR